MEGVVIPITVSSNPTTLSSPAPVFPWRKGAEYLCGNQVTACKNAVRLRVLQKALFNIGFIVHGAVAKRSLKELPSIPAPGRRAGIHPHAGPPAYLPTIPPK